MKIKSVYAVLALVLGFSTSSFAQGEGSISANLPTEPTTHSAKLIPMLGLGLGQMSIEGGDLSGGILVPDVSMMAGLLTEFGSGGVSFQTGAVYLRETGALHFFNTSSYGSSSASYTSDLKFTIEQLGIPLIAKFNLDRRTRRITFKLGAIPTYATGVSTESKTTSSINGKDESSSEKGWSRDGLRAVNVVGLLGAGIEVPLSGGRDLSFEVTYDRSILPLNTDQGGGGTKIYINSLMVSMGLGLGIL